MVAGRDDEAVEHIKRARELDPLAYAILSDSVLVNYLTGHYDEAIVNAGKMIAFDTRYEPTARKWLAALYSQKGNIERAKNEFKRFEELSDGKTPDVERAHFYSLIGERENALNYIKKVENSSDAVKESWGLAKTYANLKMPEEAFKWLEIAVENHGSITLIAASPDFDYLHSDPRFIKLLERLNMAEFWRDKLGKQ